ncbi:MAG: histidine kinase dimerization/phospho-acceptor domain-containing protein [Hyphomicrobiaceae bacterium]
MTTSKSGRGVATGRRSRGYGFGHPRALAQIPAFVDLRLLALAGLVLVAADLAAGAQASFAPVVVPHLLALAGCLLILPLVLRGEGGRDVATGSGLAELEARNARLVAERASIERDAQRLAALSDQLAHEKAATERDVRNRDRLLAHLSHQLRTPLTNVIGFSDLLADEIFGAHAHPKYADYARHVSESAGRLLTTCEDLMALAEVGASGGPVSSPAEVAPRLNWLGDLDRVDVPEAVLVMKRQIEMARSR